MTEAIRKFRREAIPFPRTGPRFDPSIVPTGLSLDVEVGCGVGYHPIRYVRTNPDRFLIAIEKTRNKYQKFESRLAGHEKLPRLLPVHADAVEWITHYVPRECVDRYFFLYPNPNPKPKDENKRWYAMPFMEKVIETLKPGGVLCLATNEKFYAEGARSFLTECWGLSLLEYRELNTESSSQEGPAGGPRTHFEKKYLARGQTCYDLVLQKVESSFKLK